MTRYQTLFVSVIIPTYRDWDRVRRCVNCLSAQSYPSDQFEIIVVNNAPDCPPPRDIRWPQNLKLVEESRTGSYAARNAGIRASIGSVLAFTDSDCAPDSQWIELAIMAMANGTSRLAGRVELTFRSSRLNCVEAYEKAFAFRQDANAEQGTSVTANMIARREAFERVGLFNDSLFSGGDIEWGCRAEQHGLKIAYAPEAVVRHPARSTLRELLKKHRRVAGGSIRIAGPSTMLGFVVFAVRGFLPPMRGFLYVIGRPDMGFRERAGALGILYVKKVYTTYQAMMLLLGLSKPSRD